jgi:hypothetical protein
MVNARPFAGTVAGRRVGCAAHVARAPLRRAAGDAGRGGEAAGRHILLARLLPRALHLPRAYWRTIHTLLLDGKITITFTYLPH